MDRLYHLTATLVGQGVAQQGLERLLLRGGGHGGLPPEHRLHQLRVVLAAVPGVVEGVIQVGAAVVKGGKEEAQLRL